ncbi:ATP-grasp fold amidoligase family protein, partial [Dehalobacter sp. UNSWDHB]|uniref:ATP-grasp fold amidoligase family protein n=1 Tax=Dehalobacter sp. UNSWDHB TaxID=1339256 RepID=UPI00055624B8
CTHDSGGNVICKAKNELDIESTRDKINRHLKLNYFYHGREWPYKGINPRIVCENYMVDESGTELKDYKIFCFSGEPKLIQVDYDRFSGHKRNLYDTDWNYIAAYIQYPTDANVIIKKPERLAEMLRLARVLAKDYPHVRIDFYLINSHIYFGEITFYHESGFGKFDPDTLGLEMGSWVKLPQK